MPPLRTPQRKKRWISRSNKPRTERYPFRSLRFNSEPPGAPLGFTVGIRSFSSGAFLLSFKKPLSKPCNVLCHNLSPECNRDNRTIMSKSGFDAEFDVVVVGAGSAGCVLSARLTENPDITLCAIEAGGRDRNPWIHIPMGFGKLVPNPNVNWGYADRAGAGPRRPQHRLAARQGVGRLRLHQRPRLPARRAKRLRRMAAARRAGLELPGRAALLQADGALRRRRQ